MPGISSKPKNNNQTKKFFGGKKQDIMKINIDKLNNLEVIQDGKDHASIKPSQKYLDEKNQSMSEALEEWNGQGDNHKLSKELEGACVLNLALKDNEFKK